MSNYDELQKIKSEDNRHKEELCYVEGYVTAEQLLESAAEKIEEICKEESELFRVGAADAVREFRGKL